MPTLYEISSDLAALAEILRESAGEITPEAEAAFSALEAEMISQTETKVDAYCALIAELQAAADARKSEAARLSALARTDERAVESLRSRLLWFIETNRLGRIRTRRFSVAVVVNGGRAPLVVDPLADLPDWAAVVDRRPNSDAIRERLEAGETLPFASLGQRGRRLSIR